jgi:cholesterol oxidase
VPNTKIDYSQGSAITSSFYPEEHTHVEPVRYGKGSNLMGLLQTIMTDGDNARDRRRQWLGIVVRKPRLLVRMIYVRKWSQRTIIALVMQNVNSSITVTGKRHFYGWSLTSKNDSANPNATWIPKANETVRRIAENHGGIAGGNLGDLINAPMTAHFVGGCVIGADESKGVIDPYHRVWNYPTLHIVDGSAVTANLGVNPALTITAQAERAFSFWPNAGQRDSRPTQGENYRQIEAVRPLNPVVPDGAPGALR